MGKRTEMLLVGFPICGRDGRDRPIVDGWNAGRLNRSRGRRSLAFDGRRMAAAKRVILQILGTLFEFFDSFAHGPSDFRQAFGPKHDKSEDHDDRKLPDMTTTEHD